MGSSSSKPSPYPVASQVPRGPGSLQLPLHLPLRQKQDAVIHASSFVENSLPGFDPYSSVLPERPSPKPRRFSLKWKRASQQPAQSPICPPFTYPPLPLSPSDGNSVTPGPLYVQSPERSTSVGTEPYWSAPPRYRESIGSDSFTLHGTPVRQTIASQLSSPSLSTPILRKPLPPSRDSPQLQSADGGPQDSTSLCTSPQSAVCPTQVAMISSSRPQPQLDTRHYHPPNLFSGTLEDPIDLTVEDEVSDSPSGSRAGGGGRKSAKRKNRKKQHQALYDKLQAPQGTASQRSITSVPEVKAEQAEPNQPLPQAVPDSRQTPLVDSQHHSAPSPKHDIIDGHEWPETNPFRQPRRRGIIREPPPDEDSPQAPRQSSPLLGDTSDYNDSGLSLFVQQEEAEVANERPEDQTPPQQISNRESISPPPVQLGHDPFLPQGRSDPYRVPSNNRHDRQPLQHSYSDYDISDLIPTQSRRRANKRRRREISHKRPQSPPYSGLYPRLHLPDPDNHTSQTDNEEESLNVPASLMETRVAADQEALDRALAEYLQEEEYASADIDMDLYESILPRTNGVSIELSYDRDDTRAIAAEQGLGVLYRNDACGGPSGPPTYNRVEQEDEDLKVAKQIQQEELELMRQQAAPKTRDCIVCGDPTPIVAFPSLLNCEHEPQTCADCYRGWIESELNHKTWNEIKCPQHKCKVILQHPDVQQHAAPEIYERFDQLSARSALNDEPNFRWCRAPNCVSGQIHISGVEGNIFRCIACGYRICVVHEDTWHEGETCEEFDYRTSGRKERDQKEQNKASLEAIEKLAKKCPGQGCGWNIQKNDGCDHMTCSRCRYEFCWVCLASYAAIRKKGNSSHLESCKYHSSRIR